MKNFFRLVSIYFLDFLFPEIPNLIQILTFILVLSFLLPDKYGIWMTTTLFLFGSYLVAKLYRFPQDFYDKEYLIDNLKRFFNISSILSLIILALVFWGIIQVTKIIAIETKLRDLERVASFKQLKTEEVASFLKNN